LAADIPNIQLAALMLYSFDLEPEGGGNLRCVFAQKLLQDGCLSGVVQAEYEQSELLLLGLGLLDDFQQSHLYSII